MGLMGLMRLMRLINLRPIGPISLISPIGVLLSSLRLRLLAGFGFRFVQGSGFKSRLPVG